MGARRIKSSKSIHHILAGIFQFNAPITKRGDEATRLLLLVVVASFTGFSPLYGGNTGFENGPDPESSQYTLNASVVLERCGDKLWLGNSANLRTWNYRWTDEWGGQNYWCISPGASCHEYDWWAHYPGTDVDPCTEINYREYGLQCIEDEASGAGFDLPTDFEVVDFVNTFPE